jgi:hypothetical protein
MPLAQREARPARLCRHVVQAADAPCGIAGAQVFVERRVARRCRHVVFDVGP